MVTSSKFCQEGFPKKQVNTVFMVNILFAKMKALKTWFRMMLFRILLEPSLPRETRTTTSYVILVLVSFPYGIYDLLMIKLLSCDRNCSRYQEGEWKLIGEELTKKIKQGLHYILNTCQEDSVEKLVNTSL